MNFKKLLPAFLRHRLGKLKRYFLRRKGIREYLAWADHPGVVSGNCPGTELFKKYIRVVHLEIDRFCNRRCVYCANHKIPGRREHSVMPDKLFEKCLSELRDISYNGYIEFNGFNEPLADVPLVLKRIKSLKLALPECRLLINSNADYLNQDLLNTLAAAGVDYMMITLHLNENEFHLNDEQRLQKFNMFAARLPACTFAYDPSMEVWSFKHPDGLSMIVRVSDFCVVGHNFAGCAGKKIKRRVPCFVPLVHCYIDYSGRIAFCCSANLDAQLCAPLIAGDENSSTMFDVFASKKTMELRHKLLNAKNMPACCQVCDAQIDYPVDKNFQRNPYYPFFE